MRTVVISGLSGSGKSSAVKTMEDLGFYCVDNMPVPLLQQFMELTKQSAEEIGKLALVIDARDKKHIGELPQALEHLSGVGHSVELVFLEASDEVLTRRFSETRHRHPLSPAGSPLEGIRLERSLLAPIRKLAKTVIDTSELSSNDLRRQMMRSYGSPAEQSSLAISVSSFGFKYGVPANADLLFDVRFLSNPFFREELKEKRGTEPGVVEFVMGQKDAGEFLTELKRLFDFLIPRFEREGKSYLHIAVGCTGGRHRSVVISAQLAKMIEAMGYSVNVAHRDLGRE